MKHISRLYISFTAYNNSIPLLFNEKNGNLCNFPENFPIIICRTKPYETHTAKNTALTVWVALGCLNSRTKITQNKRRSDNN